LTENNLSIAFTRSISFSWGEIRYPISRNSGYRFILLKLRFFINRRRVILGMRLLANLPSEEPLLVMKIVIFGDEAVGKTSILKSCLEHNYAEDSHETIGIGFANKLLSIGDRQIVLQFWELKGGSQYENLRSLVYPGALGGILVYDVTHPETFQNCSKWVQQYWQNNGRGIIPLVILGNKVDLRCKFSGSVTPEEGQRYCKKLSEKTIPHGFEVKYLETSAKTAQNICEAFDFLGKTLLKLFNEGKSLF
jgi:small GTP-binding protein